MTAEKRLTSDELVQELRAALDADSGWLPALCAPTGPVGLRAHAELPAIVDRLLAFASTQSLPTTVAPAIRSAAEAADAALISQGAVQYGHLGTAYAYITQARAYAVSLREQRDQ
ncbi:hypothetical protein ACJ6WF_49345 [Streptomyces sp. MMS24-I2-30]|uniref:hypothetical protein n=1 Tax=Streptomyces sp. MMS24-I2-30 TaxID=3351564 RepID=UPI003896A508